MTQPIVLFDGDCSFCDAGVRFILKHDHKHQFQFASLQGKTGQKLTEHANLPNDLDSFVLITHEDVYTKSTAALQVAKQLNGLWKGLYAFIALPRPFRDMVYTIIARNRYKWFGKKDHCFIPTPEVRKRFYD